MRIRVLGILNTILFNYIWHEIPCCSWRFAQRYCWIVIPRRCNKTRVWTQRRWVKRRFSIERVFIVPVQNTWSKSGQLEILDKVCTNVRQIECKHQKQNNGVVVVVCDACKKVIGGFLKSAQCRRRRLSIACCTTSSSMCTEKWGKRARKKHTDGIHVRGYAY